MGGKSKGNTFMVLAVKVWYVAPPPGDVWGPNLSPPYHHLRTADVFSVRGTTVEIYSERPCRLSV